MGDSQQSMLAEDGETAKNAGLVAVRGCDGCTLCCKVMGVQPLSKPAGTWCQHCKTGVGCGIYESRPAECAAFLCGFLLLPELTEEWRPAVSRLIISPLTLGNRINVDVDPGRPDAWRRQPYYASLKAWSRRTLAKAGQVVVRVAGRSIVVLPDHSVDLGIVATDELIVVLPAAPGQDQSAGNEPGYEAYAVKRDLWNSAGFEAVHGKMMPLPVGTEGFRSGRRLD
jgi:hypothetical protein